MDQVWTRALGKGRTQEGAPIATQRQPPTTQKTPIHQPGTIGEYTGTHGNNWEHLGNYKEREQCELYQTTCLSPRSPHAPFISYPVHDTRHQIPVTIQPVPVCPIPGQSRPVLARPAPRWEAFSVALPLPLLVQTASTMCSLANSARFHPLPCIASFMRRSPLSFAAQNTNRAASLRNRAINRSVNQSQEEQ